MANKGVFGRARRDVVAVYEAHPQAELDYDGLTAKILEITRADRLPYSWENLRQNVRRLVDEGALVAERRATGGTAYLRWHFKKGRSHA